MSMNSPPIRFGTDGWRGIIADTFTFDNVRQAAQATADHLRTVEECEPGVFLGYDARFLSPRFAEAAAQVFAGNGFRAALMDRPYPTPYVSYEVRRRKFAGGIVITASHNPSVFNGFKVKAAFGGSATPTMTRDIEARLGQNPVRTAGGAIETVEPEPHYVHHLRSLLDWSRISRSKLKVVVDSMHGSGGTILEDMLRDTSCAVLTIHGNADPLFGGFQPEPMMPQLEPLARAVVETGSDIGLATDGDADRLGIVDESGQYVDTLQALSLLLLHVYRGKGWRGAVARTVSQSLLVPRIAMSLGLELFETPVGFKNIAELMLDREILIGGEESGGIGLSRHLPERDGIFINLLLLDLLATSEKSCRTLIREMWREFGEFHYARRDLHVPVEVGEELVRKLGSHPPSAFAGRLVRAVVTLDGSKLFLEPDSWILFRQSGTESLLRVYCEAPTPAGVREILSSGMRFVEQSVPNGVTCS